MKEREGERVTEVKRVKEGGSLSFALERKKNSARMFPVLIPPPIPRPGHTKFLFSGQKKIEISGHFSGHQNDVFTLK